MTVELTFGFTLTCWELCTCPVPLTTASGKVAAPLPPTYTVSEFPSSAFAMNEGTHVPAWMPASFSMVKEPVWAGVL